MATFKLSDLDKALSKMMADHFAAQAMKMQAFAAMFPPSPPLPWYRRVIRDVRYYVTRFRYRLGAFIAGRSFDD